MNNYENQREKIDALWEDNCKIAINKDTNKIGDCDKTDCNYCLFSVRYSGGRSCKINRERWLVAEYIEPQIDWSEIPVDTPVLVSNDKHIWYHRHFAEKIEERPYVWSDGYTSWTALDKFKACYPYIKLAEVE